MQIFSVSQFVDFLNTALATAVFPDGVVIEGEVAEYRVSQDKWIWFVLKDETSVVPCFATVWQLRAPLEDGMRVRVYGRPKVHPKSGKFSVTVERVEFVGEGALRRAFELLKKKLADDGLFSAERKRPLPRFPERIGLIASRESAAYTDFLRILRSRWGGMTVHHAHVRVQGAEAVPDIVGAFRHFNEHPELAEVVVLTRGGGSLHDLQAFNAEEVARAVFGSRAPVVVGVGHERDETLADFAADVRAATPTHAAEIVAPDRRAVAAFIASGAENMQAAMRAALSGRARAVDGMARQMETHARMRIEDLAHLFKDLVRRFAAFRESVSHRSSRTDAAAARLIASAGHRVAGLLAGVEARERMLKGLDPRRLLARGYALVRRQGKVLADAELVDIGEAVDVQLHKGRLIAEVTEKP